MLDRLLEDMGLTRKDLRYHFVWKGRRYYIPTFNPLWWIVSVIIVTGLSWILRSVVTIVILLSPRV